MTVLEVEIKLIVAIIIFIVIAWLAKGVSK